MIDFPNVDDETFLRSPLKHVIFQVRFNEILRIAEAPADFQEEVQGEFPILTRQHNVLIGESGQSGSPSVTWQFRSEDEREVLSLAQGSLSVETSGYVDFPDFKKKLTLGLGALTKLYSPPTFTRVGLRYVNQAIRPFDGTKRPDWQGWVNPELFPAVTLKTKAKFDSSAHLITMARPDGTINLRYGFNKGTLDEADGEALILDADYFCEGKTAPDEVASLVTKYNAVAYQLFRWAAGDNLIDAMRKKEGDDVIFSN